MPVLTTTPSAYVTAYQSAAARMLLDTHGELVIYTPSGGTGRLVMAIVERGPRSPLPGLPGGVGWGMTVRILIGETAMASTDDGYGCITPGELSTGIDTITTSERIGGAAVARPVGANPTQDGGMWQLEVR